MAVGPVQNTSQLAQATTAATGSNGALGKDAFMKLLVAQLKNQDPLNPTDAREFVTQLSQLTSVEQMVSMGDKLTSLQTATAAMAANQASSMIGKNVEADGSALTLGATGTVSSGIHLGTVAENVTLTIRDATGKTVRTTTLGHTPAGTQPFAWDGMDDTGTRAASGTYTLSVEAKNAAGHPIEANAKISGIVNSVSYDQGAPVLIVGSASVALSNVTSISN